MSQFKTQLKVEWVAYEDDGPQEWKLLEDLVYESDLLGRDVVVPAGYVTDFASVPRAPIAYFLAGNTGHRAAVVHDYLIDTDQVDRDLADLVFKEALDATGVNWAVRNAMYLAVQGYTQSLKEAQNPPDPPSG
jgi:hypothetical protein